MSCQAVPRLLRGIFRPDHFTAQATADCGRSCGRASEGALHCGARGRPRLVLELDSLLKPGASSTCCFASMLQSHCCTVHPHSLGTYCAAISPLCGSRFCIAESHGVFSQGGFVSFGALLLWERSRVSTLVQNKTAVMKPLSQMPALTTPWLRGRAHGLASFGVKLNPAVCSGPCGCPVPGT